MPKLLLCIIELEKMYMSKKGLIMEIREIKDFYTFSRLEQSAYAAGFTGTKSEAEEVAKYFKKLSTMEETKVMGAFEEQLLGGYIHYDFTLNFHGQMIPSAGIGSVAVDLLHKKKHVAQEMILNSMKKAEEDGKEIYFLYPFNSKFYQNFGFGYGVPMNTYCVAPKDFKDIGDRSLLSYYDGEDFDEIIAFYDEKVDETHGMFKSIYGDKSRLVRSKKGRTLVAKKDNKIIGYMHYTQAGINKENDQDQKITVVSIHYNTEALLAFSSFFYAQKDQVNYIEIATHDEYFHFVLQDICYAKAPKTANIIATKIADQALGLMSYVLQPQKLLDRLNVPLSYQLEFLINYPNGDKKLVSYGEGDLVNLELSINDFSSWIMGVITLEALEYKGRLKTESTDLLRDLDQKFYLKKPKCFTRF